MYKVGCGRMHRCGAMDAWVVVRFVQNSVPGASGTGMLQHGECHSVARGKTFAITPSMDCAHEFHLSTIDSSRRMRSFMPAISSNNFVACDRVTCTSVSVMACSLPCSACPDESAHTRMQGRAVYTATGNHVLACKRTTLKHHQSVCLFTSCLRHCASSSAFTATSPWSFTTATTCSGHA